MALEFKESAILACDLGINAEVAVSPLELTLAEERRVVEELGVNVGRSGPGRQAPMLPNDRNLTERFDALYLLREGGGVL